MKRLLREADVYMGEKERQLSFNDPPSRSYDRFSAAVPVTGMGSCDAIYIRELHDRLRAAVPLQEWR